MDTILKQMFLGFVLPFATSVSTTQVTETACVDVQGNHSCLVGRAVDQTPIAPVSTSSLLQRHKVSTVQSGGDFRNKASAWEVILATMGDDSSKIRTGLPDGSQYKKPNSMAYEDFLADCQAHCEQPVGGQSCAGFCILTEKHKSPRAFFYSSATALTSGRPAWNFYKKQASDTRNDSDQEAAIAIGSATQKNKKAEVGKGHGSKVLMTVLFRPLFAKAFRCAGRDCSDCSGDVNCWGHGGADESLFLRSGPRISVDGLTRQWTHFSYVIHLVCGSPEVLVRFGIHALAYGTFSYSLDGQPVTKTRFNVTTELLDGLTDVDSPINFDNDALPPSNAARNRIFVVFPLARPGGHEVHLTFRPNSPTPQRQSHVNVMKIMLLMPESYATCEDQKACLKVLDDTDGLELRNKNHMQLECLTAELSSLDELSACFRWRDCLLAESETHLKYLLIASASSNGQVTPRSSIVAKSSNRLSSEDCINPDVEDPEAWMCDCFDEMQERCNEINSTSIETCLRAQFCLYDGVCSWWADDACHDNATLGYIEKLQQLTDVSLVTTPISDNSSDAEAALLSRSAKRQSEADATLDETAATKQCS